MFAELKDPVRAKLERYELIGPLDPDHFFPTLDAAVDALPRADRRRLGAAAQTGADAGLAMWQDSGLDSKQARRLARLLPVVRWLPRYERRWLRGDLMAGIAVTALVVPKNLGYAGIAGVPVQNGLYAAAAGAIIYALFCTSRQISTGPSSSLAAVAGGAVLVTELAGQQAAQLVAAITLVTGVLFLLLALLRMGWIAQFLSKAVVTGFLAGAAVDVVDRGAAQADRHLVEGDSAWRELATWIQGRSGTSAGRRCSSGWFSLGVILGLRFSAPRVPGALVLVVGGLIASGLLDLGAHGVALVGHVPRGLPAPALPGLTLVKDHYATIGIAAVALLLIGFSQTAGDARAFATRHRYRIDVNQESVAQGMANVGAGVFQGMPVSTSLSASSLNESAGASTPVASLVDRRPRAPDAGRARAALLASAEGRAGGGDHRRRRLRDDRRRRAAPPPPRDAVRLLDRGRGDPRRASAGRARRRRDRRRALAGWLIYVATPPRMPVLGREPGTQVFRELDENPGDETFPGIAVLRLDGGLFFATAEALDDAHPRLIREAEPDCTRSCSTSKASTSSTPRAPRSWPNSRAHRADGVSLRLARVKPPVLKVLEADGVLELIGSDHVHGNVDRALEAELAERGSR